MKTSPDASEKDGYKMNCKDDCKCKGCRKKAMREESVEKTWSEEARKKAAETRKRKVKAATAARDMAKNRYNKAAKPKSPAPSAKSKKALAARKAVASKSPAQRKAVARSKARKARREFIGLPDLNNLSDPVKEGSSYRTYDYSKHKGKQQVPKREHIAVVGDREIKITERTDGKVYLSQHKDGSYGSEGKFVESVAAGKKEAGSALYRGVHGKKQKMSPKARGAKTRINNAAKKDRMERAKALRSSMKMARKAPAKKR